MNSQTVITVLGAGSWGTALAIQFARIGQRTLLWGRKEDRLDLLQADRENRQFLPGAAFPESLQIEPDLEKAVGCANIVLVVVPSHVFRATLESIRPFLSGGTRLAWATKGFELATGKLPHQVAEEVLGPDIPKAVLSGPTFAKEVGAGLPSAMTVAATDEAYAQELAEAISGETFRAYTSTDIIGLEVGAAVKNVLAIGAGICDGLGFGANTRVALITRGLVEMTRLGIALGAVYILVMIQKVFGSRSGLASRCPYATRSIGCSTRTQIPGRRSTPSCSGPSSRNSPRTGDRPGKPLSPPGLIDRHGDRVGQIEATVSRQHR